MGSSEGLSGWQLWQCARSNGQAALGGPQVWRMEVARGLWLGQNLQLDGLKLLLRKIIFDHGRRLHKMCLAMSKFDPRFTNCVPVHFCIKTRHTAFDKKFNFC